MQVLDQRETFQRLCKETGKWGLWLSLPNWMVNDPDYPNITWNNYFDELVKAVPFLNLLDHAQSIVDEKVCILCEDEEECEDLFWQVVGEDGPTKSNPYNGPIKVYALTYNPDGVIMNENT